MRPVLYSFRRCPYAIRARLALAVSGQHVELREILLRDKPDAFLAASPSATVPCLVTQGAVIDESLDIMVWALRRNDPENWLHMPQAGWDLIAEADGPFKTALDRTKYASRYPDEDPVQHRAVAMAFLRRLDEQLRPWLFEHACLADFAILPFVRQFALIDRPWFDAQPLPALRAWLDGTLNAPLFHGVMTKFPVWQPGAAPHVFPDMACSDAVDA